MHVNPRIAELLEGLNHPSLPGIDLSLERMWRLLAALGNPHEKLPPTIHIAGTNGKGSTLAMLRSVYETAGYRVHAYTSPHLVRFNERIVVGGDEIPDTVLLPYLERIAEAARILPVTFFEATTAAALLAFAEHPADLLLLEVGLGGRLDATNTARNVIASVITPIGLDHTEFLGESLAEIAAEKAGILRPGVPCIHAEQPTEAADVLRAIAAERGVPLHGPAHTAPITGLSGTHQCDNARLVAAVVDIVRSRLPVTRAALERGMSEARWPARLQRLTRGPLVELWGERGPVILDGGHNAHAAAAIAAWLGQGHQPAVMVCGLMKRKNAAAFFHPLAPLLVRVACIAIPGAPDSYPAEELARMAPHAIACASLEEAVNRLSAVGPATLLIGGSLHLAGEVLKNHG